MRREFPYGWQEGEPAGLMEIMENGANALVPFF
jgi:hypothetical protein